MIYQHDVSHVFKHKLVKFVCNVELKSLSVKSTAAVLFAVWLWCEVSCSEIINLQIISRRILTPEITIRPERPSQRPAQEERRSDSSQRLLLSCCGAWRCTPPAHCVFSICSTSSFYVFFFSFTNCSSSLHNYSSIFYSSFLSNS